MSLLIGVTNLHHFSDDKSKAVDGSLVSSRVSYLNFTTSDGTQMHLVETYENGKLVSTEEAKGFIDLNTVINKNK